MGKDTPKAMRLLVTGASGLLGLHLSLLASEEHTVVGQVHTHLLRGVPFEQTTADLRSPDAVKRLLDQTQPDAVIHTAALALPDRCEEDPAYSEQVNALLPGWIARETARTRIPLVHISTEAIFDGLTGNYKEDDAPNPLNTYAKHKLAGERAVAEADPGAMIVRCIFYGWSLNGNRSLAEFFYNNLAAGNRVRGFTDAIFSPLLVDDLARLILLSLERNLRGIYHIASLEGMSKYDFGVGIARLFGLDERLISEASIADSGLKATRSANLSLCTDKLAAALGAHPPGMMPGMWKFYKQKQDGTAEKIRAMGQE
jgi:dTDP-4-dehydrorhamnose reductase